MSVYRRFVVKTNYQNLEATLRMLDMEECKHRRLVTVVTKEDSVTSDVALVFEGEDHGSTEIELEERRKRDNP